MGEGVTDLKAGDHVLLVFTPGECGECRYYKSKESNMCYLFNVLEIYLIYFNHISKNLSKSGKGAKTQEHNTCSKIVAER